MKVINNPEREDWKELVKRPQSDNSGMFASVRSILDDVRADGDQAVRSYTQKFDGVELQHLHVSASALEEAGNLLSPELKAAIQRAKNNIEQFHRAQAETVSAVETMPGVRCWRKSVGIERVGLYIPGGTAPLFSTVLMLGIPARIAGCAEIVLCTPCNSSGVVHPAILYCAHLLGISNVYSIGGAQAIGAMAFGTETVPQVYKIFGPGNSWVTAAKQLVQTEGVSIDMPAGPSEVCVLADGGANPQFMAADLLAQAEHGESSQVLLVSTSPQLVTDTLSFVEAQLEQLPRKEAAAGALRNSRSIVFQSMDEATAFVNAYAPEHLIISCAEDVHVAERITNAGSVFIGAYSPESVGDYASGTNHTLPTNGFARAYSGVSVDSFVKKITFQQLSREGLEHIASTVIEMAEAEGLRGHAEAVRVRLQ
jgi:histidinol dehydrogenase